MKEITLSTSRVVQIAPLKLSQARRMAEIFDSGKAMDATVSACVDSLNNAQPDAAPMLAAAFEDAYEIPEANELFAKVMEASQINMGGAPASQ